MGVEWLNRYVSIEKEDSYGVEPGTITAVAVNAAGSGYGNNKNGNWTAKGTTGQGFGASGTVTTNGSGQVNGYTVTDGGQGFSAGDTVTFTFSGGTTPLDAGSSATQTLTISADTNKVTYGEVDDESMKQTFELLTRSDMSRQVASKAVTNTQYGEGTINFAIQPDDFMGKVLYAFLPVEEIGTKCLRTASVNAAGSGGTAGTYHFSIKGGTSTVENAVVAVTTAGSGYSSAVIVNPGKAIVGTPALDTAINGTNMQTDMDGRATGISGSPTLTLALGSSAYEHVFNEPTLSTHAYPSFTMRVGREAKEHTFTGMVATKLSISANLNEYVMASVDWVGKNEESPNTLRTDVDFAGLNVDALHFADAEVYFANNASKTIKVQQVSFDININRDNDSAYAVGNRSFTRAPPTRTREITGSLEFNEVIHTTTSDEPTYADLTGSSVFALQQGDGNDSMRLKFKNEAGTEHLEIEFYNVRFEAPEASVSGRDPNRMSVNFQCFYDASQGGANKAIQAVLLGTAGSGAIQNTAYSA